MSSEVKVLVVFSVEAANWALARAEESSQVWRQRACFALKGVTSGAEGWNRLQSGMQPAAFS